MTGRTRACLLAITIVLLPAIAGAEPLSIAWDPNNEPVAGYLVHVGTEPGIYTRVIDAGANTSLTIPDLSAGQRYYVAVTAYTTSGLQSAFSTEVSGVPRGLVAAFGFEEPSGTTVLDASPAGNNGVIAGATRTQNGRYGRGLVFDGVDDVVTIGDSASLDLAGGMTVASWVRPSALSGWRTVLLKEQPGGLAYALYAHDNAPRPAAYARMAGNGFSHGTSGTTALPLNDWTHVAATYDGSHLRFYVNGALVGTEPASGTIAATSGPLRIGGNAVWGEYFSGVIDEVRVYNYPLSAAALAHDMQSAIDSGLVVAFGFEESGGSTTTDASGHGNDGRVSGAKRTAAGRFGRALTFDGVNDLVTVADAATLDSAQVTVQAWVYPTALSGWRTAVIKEAPGGMTYGLYAHDNAPRPAMTVRIGGPDYSAVGSAALPLNTWTHLAATYDGTTVRLFINGVQAGTAAIAGALTPSDQPLRIGGNLVWGEYFSGRIDEVRVYRRALSAAEIQADMNRPVAP